MKLQIKSEIKPLTKLGKLISIIAREGKALEGHRVKFLVTVTPLSEDSHKSIKWNFELRPIGFRPHGPHWGHYHLIDLESGDQKNDDFIINLPSSGISEFRIYIKDLNDEDVLLNDYGEKLIYKSESDVRNIIGIGTRFYLKQYRIYSLYDILLFFFAGMSTLGAIFEVLNYLKK